MNNEITNRIWREGDLIVIKRESTQFPNRCIKTNEELGKGSHITRRLSFGDHNISNPFVPLIYKITHSLIDMGTVTIRFGLNNELKVLYRFTSLLLGSIGLGASYLFIYGLSTGQVPPPLQLVAPAGCIILLSLWATSRAFMLIEISQMNEEHIWIHGAGEAFLSSLPEFRDRLPQP